MKIMLKTKPSSLFLCSKEIGLSYRLMPVSQAATTCKLELANKDLRGFPAKSESTIKTQQSYKTLLWATRASNSLAIPLKYYPPTIAEGQIFVLVFWNSE